jgi:tetratricopeptide (TPR) repeat protein
VRQVCLERGEYADAHDLCRQALAMQLEVLSATHPHTLRTQRLLGAVLELCGDYLAAEAQLAQAHAGLVDLLGPDHALAQSVRAQAEMLAYRRGERPVRPHSGRGLRAVLITCLAAAERSMAAEGLQHTLHGGDDGDGEAADGGGTRAAKPGVREARTGVRERGAAKVQERKARVAKGKALGGAHYVTDRTAQPGEAPRHSGLAMVHAQVLVWMAEVDRDLHRFSRAAAYLRMARAEYAAVGRVARVQLGGCHTGLGLMELEQGRLHRALAKFALAKRLKSSGPGPDADRRAASAGPHPETLDDVLGCAWVRLLRADYAGAQRELEEALALTDNKLAAANRRRGGTLLLQSRLALALGRYADADAALDAAVTLRPPVGSGYRGELEQAYARGLCLGARGRLREARAVLEQVVGRAEICLGPGDPLVCRALCECAAGELACGRTDAAEALLRDAQAVSDRIWPYSECGGAAAAAGRAVGGLVGRLLRVLGPVVERERRRDYGHPTRLRLRLLLSLLALDRGRFHDAAAGIDLVAAEHRAEAAAAGGRGGEGGGGEDGPEGPEGVGPAAGRVWGDGPERHALVCECLTGKAQVALARGRLSEAQRLFERALQGKLAAGWAAGHLSCADDREGLGRCAAYWADYDQARALLRAARESRLSAGGEEAAAAVLRIQVRRDTHVRRRYSAYRSAVAAARAAQECATRTRPCADGGLLDRRRALGRARRGWSAGMRERET